MFFWNKKGIFRRRIKWNPFLSIQKGKKHHNTAYLCPLTENFCALRHVRCVCVLYCFVTCIRAYASDTNAQNCNKKHINYNQQLFNLKYRMTCRTKRKTTIQIKNYTRRSKQCVRSKKLSLCSWYVHAKKQSNKRERWNTDKTGTGWWLLLNWSHSV